MDNEPCFGGFQMGLFFTSALDTYSPQPTGNETMGDCCFRRKPAEAGHAASVCPFDPVQQPVQQIRRNRGLALETWLCFDQAFHSGIEINGLVGPPIVAPARP